MTGKDKREAFAQLERGLRAIDRTFELLDRMLLSAEAENHRKMIFDSMAELNERRRAIDSYVDGFSRSDAGIRPPREFDYLALDQAVRLVDAIAHAPNDVNTGLHLATTVSDALRTTWENIAHRSTI